MASHRAQHVDRPGVAAILFTFLVVAGVVAAVVLLRGGPEPRGADAPPEAFSAQRAAAHVEAIAAEPHPLGSAANAEVRDYLQQALAEMGVQSEVQRTTAVSRRYGSAGTVENLVARVPGRASTGAVLLMSHYDSVSTAPGAADAASGVAAVLETVRALQASGPHANDVIVLLTDGEEAGLLGAEAFATEHPWIDEVAFAVNLEARGTRGPSVLVETHEGNAPLLRAFAPVLPRPHASSVNTEIYRLLPNDTDFSVLLDGNVPGLNYAFFRDAAAYHTPLDAPERLDPRSLQHHGDTMLAAAQRAASLDLQATALTGTEDRVYADLLGERIVHHPASWNLPLAAVTLLAWLLLLLAARRQGVVRLRDVVGGLVINGLALAAAFGAGDGLWRLLPELEPALAGAGLAAPYAVGWTLLGLALSACLAVLLVAGLGRLVLGWAGLSLAALLLHGALGLGASLYLPGASYLFLWTTLPLLTAVSVVLAAGRPDEVRPTGFRTAILLLGALPTLVLWPGVLVEGTYAIGPALAGAVAAAVALGATQLLPLLDALFGRRPLLVPLLVLLGAVGAFAWALERAPYGERQPQPAGAFYLLSPETGEARFVRLGDARDPWTDAFVGAEARDDGMAPRLLPGLDGAPSGPAPVLDLPAPTLDRVEEAVEGGTRTVSLRLASNRGARRLVLSLRADGGVREVRVADRALPAPTRHGDWRQISIYGVADEVRVTFSVDAGAEVEAVLADQTDDLLAREALAVPPRPEDTMAAPSRLSEAVLVSTRTTLAPAP